MVSANGGNGVLQYCIRGIGGIPTPQVEETKTEFDVCKLTMVGGVVSIQPTMKVDL